MREMERCFPSLDLCTERSKSKKFGVAVFVFDDSGRIFTIREKEANVSTGKKPGEYSVVCETREGGEDWEQNTRRGLQEELGIPEDCLSEIFDFPSAVVWETGFVDGVWATVVKLHCKNTYLLKDSLAKNNEPDNVEVTGWMTKEEFEKSALRAGVANILKKFINDIFDIVE